MPDGERSEAGSRRGGSVIVSPPPPPLFSPGKTVGSARSLDNADNRSPDKLSSGWNSPLLSDVERSLSRGCLARTSPAIRVC